MKDASPQNGKEPIGVCIILQNKEGKILLGERRNSYKQGSFGLPGGRIMLNETIKQTARREAQEEVGITFDDFELVGVVRELQETYNFVHFGVFVKDVTEEPKNMEPEKCKGWFWFEVDEIPDNTLPGHKELIKMQMKQGPKLVDLVEK